MGPTRAQIEAVSVAPTYTVRIWYNGGGTATDVSADIDGESGVSIVQESAGPASGVSWGEAVTMAASVPLYDPTGAYTAQLASGALDRAPIEISYGISTSGKEVAFYGIVLDGAASDDDLLALECGGWDEVIRGTAIYTTAQQFRPAATKTTASSQENPDDMPYVGGMLNEIFWRAGGRPLEQAGTYPDALYYYSCVNSGLAPEWSWMAGEDAWDEALRLARSVGGQVYQDTRGVMRYVQPLSLALGSVARTFTDAASPSSPYVPYETITARRTSRDRFTIARCPFVKRGLGALQNVYEDTAPIILDTSESRDLVLPLSVPSTEFVAVSITASYGNGGPATIAPTDVVYTAQRVTCTVANPSSTQRLCISRVAVEGRPIAVIEEGEASYDSGGTIAGRAVERPLEDNPYVQARSHAERLCVMAQQFVGTPRMIYSLSGCPYDPDLILGEVSALTSARYSLSARRVRVINTTIDETGDWMSVDLLDVADLPTRDEVFVIGASYTSGAEREVAP